MDKVIIGYGLCIRTSTTIKDRTVAYNELQSIGFSLPEVYLDIVRSEDSNRPELERAIDNLHSGDRIDIYSADVFLKGNNSNMLGLFSKAIKKGIDFLIYDFSGAVAKISHLSTLEFRLGSSEFVKTSKSNSMIISDMEEYIQNNRSNKKGSSRKTEARIELSNAFKEIYFAYESYQIDLDTTLALVSEYCGINNKVTFWRTALDYERNIAYSEDLDDYAKDCYEILSMPKRCGGLPEDYLCITKLASEHFGEITPKQKRIESAMALLGIVSSFQVYHRWELVDQGKPKPRKPVPINFDILEFKNQYSPFQV